MATESTAEIAITSLSGALKAIPETSNKTRREATKDNITAMGGVALTASSSDVKNSALKHYASFNSLESNHDNIVSAVELKTETNHLAAAIALTAKDETVHKQAITAIAKTLDTREPWGNLHTDCVLWIAAIAHSSTEETKAYAITILDSYTKKDAKDYGYEGANQHPKTVQTATKLIGVLGAF